MIRELGLLNENVYEHHVAYGISKRDHHWGVPYPGVFLLDEQAGDAEALPAELS